MNPDKIIEEVRKCNKGEGPSADISDILKKHRCYGLLQENVSLAEKVLNHIAVKERYQACKPFFENADFPYAVIKGAVLSKAAYNDALLRISGDIDILIDRRDADKAKRLLTESGFRQGRVTGNGFQPFSRKEILYQSAMSHQTAPYIKETSNKLCPYVNVDINMDILWGESKKHTDMYAFLCNREKCTLFDTQFFKLTPEAEFISLCLHHYKDMNSIYLLSKGSLRLGIFCDIYFYIKNTKPSPKLITLLSRKFDVSQYIYVCLKQSYIIFADEILIPYLEALDSHKDETLTEKFGLCDEERKTWDVPLFERLFHPNLPQYMRKFLTKADLEKIRINSDNM